MRREVLISLLLAGITLGLYWPATYCHFIHFDDQVYVTENAQVQGGLTLAGIAWAFTHAVSSNWHPLTLMSHMLDCQLFGLQPWGHHLTSLLLHMLNTVLVFLLLRRLTGALWRSAIVAALFGWHPLHVQSVAWVAERKDVLSTFFFLLSLLAYAGYAKESIAPQPAVRGRWPAARIYYFLSLGAFALGLMSKAMLVTLPFVLLLLDYWPLKRFPVSWRLVLEKLPFLALGAAGSAMAFAVQHHGGAIATMQALSLGDRLGNALISYCRYLGKIFWPADLAIFYPHPYSWPVEKVLLAAVFLSGVTALFFMRQKRYPWLLMGWLWFIGTLVPVIGLIQVGEQSMADRYTYIPSIGMFVLIVWCAFESCRRWLQPVSAQAQHSPAPKESRMMAKCALPALAIAAVAALVSCCWLTRQQLGYWRNSESLFRRALAVTENNSWALSNLGDVTFNQGRTDEAINYYQQALALKPTAADLHNNLGAALLAKGQIDEAIAESQEALRLKPEYADAYLNLGNALAKKGLLDDAIGQFQKGIRLKPDNDAGYIDLGIALLNQGRPDEAINEFHTAMGLKPATAELHNDVGIALLAKGLTDEAIAESQESIRLKPGLVPAHQNLGRAFFRKGQIDQAVAQFQEVVRLEPSESASHVNLGVALLSQGRPDEAITELLAAIQLEPAASKAHYNLSIAYTRKGDLGGAISQLQETIRLKPDDPDAKRDLAADLELTNRLGVQTLNPGTLNNLAWTLATSPDSRNRDGARAVKLAEVACQQTQYQQTILIGTLAAAYAEAGRFDEAIATAQKACDRALEQGETNFLARNKELLALYQTHRPYHEPPPDSAGSAAH
ncbi:MAG TPA: tetratricopeptide repeat protein [Verrucomicrobiae bacterium]|nr:tetratricopeptide repeat protein [Verrucomicrobiae bacterium]